MSSLDLHIRLARPEDDAAIGDLLVAAFETQYAKKLPEVKYTDERRRELRDVATKRAQGTVLVGELGGEVVGTVTVYPPGVKLSEAWRPRMADLRALGVHTAHFGKGYAQPLLDEAERIAWAWDIDFIGLHVRRGALGVARLYEKRGWIRAPEGDLDLLPLGFLEAYAKPRP
ncbi:MAG: GNAT family N-acetyltransferase [Deltaproteobacteria bacterium]|nr:GNAT family N-acetyltransferase [Deltaproteobacteria bacterium]